MKEIINEINREYSYSSTCQYIDSLYDCVRDIVGDSVQLLNRSRILMRKKDKRAIDDFDLFKSKWKCFKLDVLELKSLVPLDKNMSVLEELVENSIKRKVLSKLPIPHLDYLNSTDIKESDIDWIISKIKNSWVKYSQVYASIRLNYLLKEGNTI